MVFTRRRSLALVLALLAGVARAQTPRLVIAPTLFTPAGCLADAFPDVPQSHPFCAWIRQLATVDLIAGTCDGTNFCPDAPVTRGQLAMFLERAIRGTTAWNVNADLLDGIDSADFITGVGGSPGGGLTGGGSTGDVALSIADGGVTSTKIFDGTILFADLGANGCADGNLIQRSGSAWTCATPPAGDITGVSTSGGLSGGATSGDVALSIADGGVTSTKIFDGTILFADLGANGCADGNLIQRSGSAWTCVTPPAGDITGVSTSGGLSGGATSGEVALSIADGGVTTGKIANGTILFEDLAANGCADGNVIRRSGSVWSCAAVALPTVFQHQVTVVNTSGNTSILDHASVNNKPAVKIFVTLDNTNFAGGAQVVAVKFVDLPDPLVDRWVLENMSAAAALPVNAIYNVLVFP